MKDVIVVGAGPVGMLTALALAQTGAKVTVLEQEPGIINSPRAAVYFPSTLIILDELGLLDELNEIGFQNRTFGTHVPEFGYSVRSSRPSRSRAFPTITSSTPASTRSPGVAMEHAQKLGVEVLFEHEVTGLEDGADGVTVTVKPPAGEKAFAAKWLIGADGARSTVRKLARDRIRRLHLARTLRRHQCEVRFPQARLLPGELRLRSGQHGDHRAARPRRAVALHLSGGRVAAAGELEERDPPALRAVHAGQQGLRASSPRAPTCCTSARGRRCTRATCC